MRFQVNKGGEACLRLHEIAEELTVGLLDDHGRQPLKDQHNTTCQRNSN